VDFPRGFKTRCEALSLQIRHQLHVGPGDVLEPETLAAFVGVTLWTMQELDSLTASVRGRLEGEFSSEWSAVTIVAGSNPVIVFNSSHSRRRRASTLMHELAHILLDHTPGNMFFGAGGMPLRTYDPAQESEADWLVHGRSPSGPRARNISAADFPTALGRPALSSHLGVSRCAPSFSPLNSLSLSSIDKSACRSGEWSVKAFTSVESEDAEAEGRLRAFIDKFDPKDRTLIRAVRESVPRRLPSANELVWDNYNFFVIGYSPTERPSDSIVSIAARTNGVGLCFIHGATLPDPKGVLLGSGSQTRFIRLESASALARPEVEALVAAAIAQGEIPLPATGRGKLIIRSVSAKQRLRRKPAKAGRRRPSP
jgi:hypothetical protein